MPDEAGLVARFVDFGHELRAEGLSVGSGDILTFCAAVAALDPADIRDVYWSGRATMVNRRDQIPTYDRVFRRFFLDEPDDASDPPPRAAPASTGVRAVLEIPDSEPREGDTDDESDTSLGLMASDAEIWRQKSFAVCTPEELADLRRIMDRVRLTPPRRRSRRHRPARTRGRPDMRRVARHMMRTGQEPPSLMRSSRKLRQRPLVLILDVSGSMSDYSRNLLQFAYSTRRAAGRVEVFCFGTRLTRITPVLDRRRPDEAMALAAARVTDWDGGTRIGDSLDEFVRRWGRRGMSRGSIVVICSDGLDTGDPATLANAMERLSRLCHRIVWMNPHHRDDPDFRPSTLGMMIAAPYVDAIVSGHNLRSLGEFAESLPDLR
jgi:uncharacterized protein with von Willebrand factor type A (vWA) domain